MAKTAFDHLLSLALNIKQLKSQYSTQPTLIMHSVANYIIIRCVGRCFSYECPAIDKCGKEPGRV